MASPVVYVTVKVRHVGGTRQDGARIAEAMAKAAEQYSGYHVETKIEEPGRKE